MSIITEKMVEKAHAAHNDVVWAEGCQWKLAIRRALEAVADDIVQGSIDAAEDAYWNASNDTEGALILDRLRSLKRNTPDAA